MKLHLTFSSLIIREEMSPGLGYFRDITWKHSQWHMKKQQAVFLIPEVDGSVKRVSLKLAR